MTGKSPGDKTTGYEEDTMRMIEYALLPESGYTGTYDRKEGHLLYKIGPIADMIHDSAMLWGYDYDKRIPAYEELREILKKGEFPRFAEWDPVAIDEEEYKEIVEKLLAIPMDRPYRLE